jgi:hypothetical protein
MSKPVATECKKLNAIEPPIHIKSKDDGFKVIARCCDSLTHSRSGERASRPMVMMLFLKFDSTDEGDEFAHTLQHIASHIWKKKLKQTKNLYFLTIHNAYDETTDIFVAESKETAEMLAKLRFPETEMDL